MPKDLRSFIQKLQDEASEELVVVEREVDPRFEASAILQHLENEDKFPAVLFQNVKDLHGNPSDCRLMSNLFATRQKCALALDLPKDQWRLETSLEFAHRVRQPIKPIVVSKKEAPVKEVILTGDQVDVGRLPIMAIHEMDGQPYLNDVVTAADPDTGAYNTSHHRMMVKGRDKLGLYTSPRHLWNYIRRAEERGEALPIAQVLGHHPGFYLAAEALVPMEADEYEITGGILGEPLRLVPSEAFGDRLMVPADAEVIVEAEVLPGVREAEAPYGEFTGYYGPQRWSWVCQVKAITYRKDAIFVGMFVGHPDCSILGGIPKEGGIYEIVRGVVPTVKAVHFPISGTCRFHAYISIDQKAEGEARVAAMAAFPPFDELKLVVVVDDDIDVFNEREVLWAVATRVQADQSLDVIRHVRGGTLDPSQIRPTDGAKLVIDATKPLDRPFAERLNVPASVMERIALKEWLPAEELSRIGLTL
jgi:2,5-furandicarboxylate decarboxylase 1